MFFALRRQAFLVVLLSLFLIPTTFAQQPPKVVVTFSVLEDIVSQIGGDHIELSTLVEQGGDAHVFRPSPFHAQAVSQADLLVVNGLGFEGWLERLEQSSGFNGVKVIASDGIKVLTSDNVHSHDDDHAQDDHAETKGHDHDEHAHDEHAMEDSHSHDDHSHDDHAHDDEVAHDGHNHNGNIDPHSWHSVANVKVYALNIANALKAVDPENAVSYDENYRNYISQLDALESSLQQLAQTIPDENKQVITSHAAFGYLARDYGFEFFSPQGVSTESEASASDVATLIRQIKQRDVKAVFFENVADNRLMSQIANETGATVGGELYSGSLSADDGPAPTYIEMMTHNMTTLAEALR